MIIKSILKKLFFKKRLKYLVEKKRLYKDVTETSKIHEFQLKKFNDMWAEVSVVHPFYKMWQQKYNLPHEIKSLTDLASFPVLTKKDIQDNQNLVFDHLNHFNTISTGGSTGEPTKFPVSRGEGDFSYANHYLARGWWGIKPLDNILLFWGHSHLFGGGFQGRINQFKRKLADRLINTLRLSAYDVSLNTLGQYAEKLKNSNPSMVLGYTSTIYKISKFIQENKLQIGKKSKLKAVVVTSETVSEYDINLIQSVFGVPCVIEYGMAETGVIAYSRNKTNNIKLFWDSFIGIKDDNNCLMISTISDKLFPLINYSTGDIVDSVDKVVITTINSIEGRKNDFLIIYNNGIEIEVHSEIFTHILKAIGNVINFRVRQKRDLSIVVYFVAIGTRDISEYFFYEISKEFEGIDLEMFTFKQVDYINKTISGKAKWVEIER
jgi:phenylacetate-coenzyme A ligase PaaK-like adenylate-forming protein